MKLNIERELCKVETTFHIIQSENLQQPVVNFLYGICTA